MGKCLLQPECLPDKTSLCIFVSPLVSLLFMSWQSPDTLREYPHYSWNSVSLLVDLSITIANWEQQTERWRDCSPDWRACSSVSRLSSKYSHGDLTHVPMVLLPPCGHCRHFMWGAQTYLKENSLTNEIKRHNLFFTFSQFTVCMSYNIYWSHLFIHPFLSTLYPGTRPPRKNRM